MAVLHTVRECDRS